MPIFSYSCTFPNFDGKLTWANKTEKIPRKTFPMPPVEEKGHTFKARLRRRSTHVPNLIDELSPAKEQRLNQFGTAVLVRCGNVVKFDKVCRIIRHWSGN